MQSKVESTSHTTPPFCPLSILTFLALANITNYFVGRKNMEAKKTEFNVVYVKKVVFM